MQTNEVVNEFKAIRQEYAYDPDIFNADDERVRKLKDIINNRLSQQDNVIILLYADCLSYRKLGKKLGLSHTTVMKEVKRIKRLIRKEYESIQ